MATDQKTEPEDSLSRAGIMNRSFSIIYGFLKFWIADRRMAHGFNNFQGDEDTQTGRHMSTVPDSMYSAKGLNQSYEREMIS
ncbi:MAG: hypothetical protein JXQ27_19035, partial [Acidobacteria bacterium]|nr:hypothetical protein [Acidobacteriota bacterium]